MRYMKGPKLTVKVAKTTPKGPKPGKIGIKLKPMPIQKPIRANFA